MFAAIRFVCTGCNGMITHFCDRCKKSFVDEYIICRPETGEHICKRCWDIDVKLKEGKAHG